MNNLCIICPAVLDLECYKKHFDSLDNIFFNQNTQFEYIIHLDEHIRPGVPSCSKSEYINLVDEINTKYKNVNAKIFTSKPRLGLTAVMSFLFSKFLDTDCEFCLIIEDDAEIMNKVYLDDFFNLLRSGSEEYVYRLAMGAGHRSSENPKLLNEFISIKEHSIFETKKNSCSQNGTFFSRKLVSSFPKTLNGEPENFITRCSEYSSKKIKIIFSGHNLDFNPGTNWVLPQESHILYDGIRFLRRTGWNS